MFLEKIGLQLISIFTFVSLCSCAGSGKNLSAMTCEEIKADVNAIEQRCSALVVGSPEYEKCKTELRMGRYQASVVCKTQAMDAKSRKELLSLFNKVVGPMDIAPDTAYTTEYLDQHDRVIPWKINGYPASVCPYDRDNLCESAGALYLRNIALNICPEGTRLPATNNETKLVYDYIKMLRKYANENVGTYVSRIVGSSQMQYRWNKQDVVYTDYMYEEHFWILNNGLGHPHAIPNACMKDWGLSPCYDNKRAYFPVFCVRE